MGLRLHDWEMLSPSRLIIVMPELSGLTRLTARERKNHLSLFKEIVDLSWEFFCFFFYRTQVDVVFSKKRAKNEVVEGTLHLLAAAFGSHGLSAWPTEYDFVDNFIRTDGGDGWSRGDSWLLEVANQMVENAFSSDMEYMRVLIPCMYMVEFKGILLKELVDRCEKEKLNPDDQLAYQEVLERSIASYGASTYSQTELSLN